MLWEIQPPKWHSVCGRCTGFTELSENDDVSFPDCCCLFRCFFLFVGSSVDASILQGVARSGHLLQRCGCIIDGGFFRLMLEGQENKNTACFSCDSPRLFRVSHGVSVSWLEENVWINGIKLVLKSLASNLT